MKIKRETHGKIRDLLFPHVRNIDDRESLVAAAFLNSDIVDQIRMDGSAQTFAIRLIDTCINFGNIDGKPALILLLEELRRWVNDDKKKRIDLLIDQLHTPPTQDEQSPDVVSERVAKLPLGNFPLQTVIITAGGGFFLIIVLLMSAIGGQGFWNSILNTNGSKTVDDTIGLNVQVTIIPVTETPTQFILPSKTATRQPTSTMTPTSTPIELGIARTRVPNNDKWSPFTQSFNGVPMVLVPHGCFMMGSNVDEINYVVNELGAQREWVEDEQPAHQVCFGEPFWIDRFEVTQSDFERLRGLNDGGSCFEGNNLPEECITWFEARDFCELRDARLPTEEEWEYAARGPNSFLYAWGNEFDGNRLIYEDSRTYGDTSTASVNVRSNGASWVGASNMNGNVYEWVSTVYDKDAYWNGGGIVGDDRPDDRVIRGGSFNNSSLEVRSTNRVSYDPSRVNNSIGFRCARDIN